MLSERKKKIKELFDNLGIFLTDEDMDNLGTAISDTLTFIAEEIEATEPYATVTIGRLRDVASGIETEINED